MYKLIYNLPEQIEEAIEISRIIKIKPKKIKNLVICGMGGSGIGGELLYGIYGDKINIPVYTNRDYHLPSYISQNSLIIFVSYSGNTEETLANLETARKKNCTTAIITSNGELLKRYGHINAVVVPKGLPPRAAIGYLFTPLPIILWNYKLLSCPFPAMIRMVNFLKRERKRIIPRAAQLAKWLYGSLPIIYSSSQAFHPVAYRWRCQFNENSKVFAHSHIIPEMNHNEIVGIGRPRKIADLTRLIFLTDVHGNKRNLKRVKITRDLIGREVGGATEFTGKGKSIIERVFYLIWLGDYASYYLARLGKVNPMPVKRIEALKARLK